MTLWRALARGDVQEALGTSLLTATVSTVLVAVWGVPLAWALARDQFPGKGVVESLVDLPILVRQSVAGVALITLLGPASPMGSALESLGQRISGSAMGIVIAQVFVSAPFLVKAAVSGFEAVPAQLELASRSLGCGAAKTFWRISLPLASRSLLIGAALSWARAVSEFGTIILFASSPATAPVLVHTEFLRGGAADSRPIATLLLVVCLWAFLLLQLGGVMLPFALRRHAR
jgi:molybdate/tungstate transport system permease protein